MLSVYQYCETVTYANTETYNVIRLFAVDIPQNRTNIRYLTTGWLGGTTGSASDQRSEGCGFEAY